MPAPTRTAASFAAALAAADAARGTDGPLRFATPQGTVALGVDCYGAPPPGEADTLYVYHIEVATALRGTGLCSALLRAAARRHARVAVLAVASAHLDAILERIVLYPGAPRFVCRGSDWVWSRHK